MAKINKTAVCTERAGMTFGIPFRTPIGIPCGIGIVCGIGELFESGILFGIGILCGTPIGILFGTLFGK